MIQAVLGYPGQGMSSGTALPYQNVLPVLSAVHCQFCGSAFPVRSSLGRKAHFCSDNCRDAQKFFDAFKVRLRRVKTFSPYSRKIMRGELFLCSNSLTVGGAQ